MSSSLTLFLYLCRSEFWPRPFSYSLKNVFLTFIAGLFARDTTLQLLFILECVYFSFIALLKYIFSRYSILGWCIFFLSKVSIFHSLSSCLHALSWEVWCDSYFCPSIGKVFLTPWNSFKICSLSLDCFSVIWIWFDVDFFNIHLSECSLSFLDLCFGMSLILESFQLLLSPLFLLPLFLFIYHIISLNFSFGIFYWHVLKLNDYFFSHVQPTHVPIQCIL